MAQDPKNAEELLKKYGGKTPEELERDQDALEGEVNVQAQAMDQQIQQFSSKTDEMKTPEGIVLAVVRHPTAAQFTRFVPPELAKYKNNPENMPYDTAIKYEQDIYKLMEELIVYPKHSAKEWQELVGDDFTALFQAHLMNVRKKVTETIKSFL